MLCTEFAEYTSAQEMIPLGRKSRKVAAAKQREERQELIADAYVRTDMPELNLLIDHS